MQQMQKHFFTGADALEQSMSFVMHSSANQLVKCNRLEQKLNICFLYNEYQTEGGPGDWVRHRAYRYCVCFL